MKKSANITYKLANLSLQIAIFAISLCLIFGASYIVGRSFLLGNGLWGNDSDSFFSVVSWLNSHFPKYYFWYPLQGGGVSFDGYPTLSAYLVIVLDRLSSFDLVQSFRLMGFLSIPLTGLGIFMFAWTRLTSIKPVWVRQILGLFGAVLYVVSPIAWIWLVRWGFFAESVSHIFVAPTIIFFDLFLEKVFKNQKGLVFRLSFLGTLIFLTLAFITHFLAAVSLIPLFTVMFLVRLVFHKDKSLKEIFRILVPLSLLGVASLGFILFRLYPYSTYMQNVAQGGFRGYGQKAEQSIDDNTLPPKILLSIENPADMKTDPHSTIVAMRYPLYVWILMIPSVLFGVFVSKKLFAFSLYSAIGFVVTSSVPIKLFSQKIPLFSSFIGWYQDRAFFIPARITIPISAAFGIYVLIAVIFIPLVKKFDTFKLIKNSLSAVRGVVALTATFAIVAFLLTRFYGTPYTLPYYINIGGYNDPFDLRDLWRNWEGEYLYNDEMIGFLSENPDYGWLADFQWMRDTCRPQLGVGDYPDGHICDFYEKGNFEAGSALFPPKETVLKYKDYCANLPESEYEREYLYCKTFYRKDIKSQLALSNWPSFEVSSDISVTTIPLEKQFSELDKNVYRYDFSGYQARKVMASPIVNDNSQIQLYINTLSLIYNNWNYMSTVMYAPPNQYQKPGALDQLGWWFGTDYISLAGSDNEPLSYWQQETNWEDLGSWKKYNNAPGLVTWSSRPSVLVISDNSRNLYDQMFKFFVSGGLKYDQAIPVYGGKYLDNYSSSELKKFDAIIMRGYDYKSRTKAYKLLDDYVNSGGSLIFDTGWQANVPDYVIPKAPSFFPVKGLEWKNLSTNSHFISNDPDLAKEEYVNSFGPLIWSNTSWGVSAPTELRDWAKPVVSYDNTPLVVAGEYGEGKVVWIGFNIVAHSEDKDAVSESYLFSDLVNYALDGKEIKTYSALLDNPIPDKFVINLSDQTDSQTAIYFRESYHPYWKATLTNGQKQSDLKIYKAGPGFDYIILPAVASGSKITFSVKKPPIFYMSQIITLLAILSTLAYVIYPKLIRVPKIESTRLKFKNPVRKTIKNIKKDEDYDY